MAGGGGQGVEEGLLQLLPALTCFIPVGVPLQNHGPSFAKLPMYYIPQSGWVLRSSCVPCRESFLGKRSWSKVPCCGVWTDQTDTVGIEASCCSLWWVGAFRPGQGMVWLRPECHTGIEFRLYTPFRVLPRTSFCKLPLQNFQTKKKSVSIVKPYKPWLFKAELRGKGVI